MVAETADHAAFLKEWGALPVAERRRIRRLVRLGRPLEPGVAGVGVAYARFQSSRIWARTFWLWFVPGLFVALNIAARLHPIVVGIVIALAVQAWWSHHNARRAERINSSSPQR